MFIAVFYAGQQSGFAQTGIYSVKKYTIEDGLPDLYVLSMCQDSRGFMWIGTVNGLSRFDGKNFVTYSVRQGLNTRYVNYLLEDDQGRFWVGASNKIFRFINNHFIEYPFSDPTPFKYIIQIKQLKNGELWVLTDAGAYYFNTDHWEKKTLVAGFENKLCHQLLETAEGIYYDYRTVIIFKDLKGNISTIWEHEVANRGMYFSQLKLFHDTLYIANFDGIYQMTGNKIFKKLFPGALREKTWRGFFIDSGNRFWVTEIARAHVLITDPGNKQEFSDSIVLSIPLVSFSYEDKDHNIWIASGEGLLKVQTRHTNQYNIATNPLINDIRNIIATPNKNIFAFSRENGILQFVNNNFIKAPIQFYQTDKEAKNDFPDSYAIDDKNRSWWATRESRLYYLDNGKLFKYAQFLDNSNYLDWISYNPVTQKLFTSQDTLKTITEKKMSLFKAINSTQLFMQPEYIHCFKNGKTISISSLTGVRMIDKDDKLIAIGDQLGLGNSIARAHFYETTAGDFWMYGSGDGIKHFNWNKNGLPENDLQISTDDGLPSDMVVDMCMDQQKRLWVTTMAGPAIIKLDTVAKKIEVSPLNDNFDIKVEDAVNSHLISDNNNNIWLTAHNTIYRFDPGKIVFKSSIPRINIEDIRLNQKITDWEKYTGQFTGYWQLPVNPVLQYNENTLQINFTGISFTSSAGFVYSYRLIGLDTNWSSPSASSFVLFAKLLPGHYNFYVKCKTKNGDWSEAAVFSFTIKPPFWNTWWFRLLIIAVVALVIFAFYRNRVKKIEQQALLHNQLVELEMTALKAQMNPHFIYNALNSIQALVVEEKKDDAIHYIGTFSRLLRQVLENSERNVITLQKELQTLELYINLDALRLNMQPIYSLHIDKDVQTGAEKIPPLILQPFAENALWHGLSKKEGNKEIAITITIDNDWLVCVVQDNGIGRAKAAALKTRNTSQYQSKAIAITTRRLIDFNEDKSRSPIVFEDLLTENGDSAGTKVILYIKRKS